MSTHWWMSGTQVSPVYYVLPQVAKLPHGPCQLTGGVGWVVPRSHLCIMCYLSLLGYLVDHTHWWMSGTQVSPVYYVLFRLLGYLVDHIDSLVDEWYPGLTCIDPLLGHELLQKFVPCTTCTGQWTVLSALSPAVCTCNGTSLKHLILCLILSLTVNQIPGCNGISNADSTLQNKAKTMFRMKKSFAWLKMIKWIYIAGYFTQAGLVVFGLDNNRIYCCTLHFLLQLFSYPPLFPHPSCLLYWFSLYLTSPPLICLLFP